METMIAMYYYFDSQGNKVWTSNEALALSRARAHNSEVYRIEIPVTEKK
jgi:hypothetical protein